MRLTTTILLVCLAVLNSSCGTGQDQWKAPASYTLREDGILRRKVDGKEEAYTVAEFIAKVRKEEGKDFVLVVAPSGEIIISARIAQLEAKIIELENQINDMK
jgi:hypothetical protein